MKYLLAFDLTLDGFIAITGMQSIKISFVAKVLILIKSRQTDALGNLNGFFDNLASNMYTMENRNLLPNQMRLLGEQDNRPRDTYGHSSAFVNSVSLNLEKISKIKLSSLQYFHSTGSSISVA